MNYLYMVEDIFFYIPDTDCSIVVNFLWICDENRNEKPETDSADTEYAPKTGCATPQNDPNWREKAKSLWKIERPLKKCLKAPAAENIRNPRTGQCGMLEIQTLWETGFIRNGQEVVCNG